ncbi:SurA N-terminal domain-containing protein [Candidatus Pacebacteria bacterium]|nr:SurA N-terminal domain-containing protein [Candidatus Paceibacterota bacterium]
MEEQNNQNNEANTSETDVSASQNATRQESERKPSMQLIVGVVLTVLVLGGGFWYLQGDTQSLLTDTQPTDISTIDPSQVVAKVNGVELFGSDFILQAVQAVQAAGLQSIDDADVATKALIQSQALDAIVNTELIVQTAKSSGIVVAQEDIEAEFAILVENIGGQEIADQRLAELNLTVEEFKLNLSDDILIRQYLESTKDASVLAVSEEEILAFYTEASAGQTEEVPALDEVRAQIEEQLKFQKQQNELLSLLEVLRAQADIEFLIN